MKLEPIITEKSMSQAKEGKYTFRVDRNATKHQIKGLVEKIFGVNVIDVNTLKVPGEVKRTLMGRKRVVKPGKKAVVKLKDKQKIDIFVEEKKGKK
jgi:large subunit ribosomal protein L23